MIASFVALKKSRAEADGTKKQMEGLAREYERLLKEHQELQVILNLETAGQCKRRVYSCHHTIHKFLQHTLNLAKMLSCEAHHRLYFIVNLVPVCYKSYSLGVSGID